MEYWHGGNYEINFLHSQRNKVILIEVKTSRYSTHDSYDAFCETTLPARELATIYY